MNLVLKTMNARRGILRCAPTEKVEKGAMTSQSLQFEITVVDGQLQHSVNTKCQEII